jgi:hypothetical protein
VAAKREPHEPTSEIHSQVHADHALVSRWLMEIPLASAEAEDNEEHSGNVHVEQELTEENRSNFEKVDLKTLANSARNTLKKRKKGREAWKDKRTKLRKVLRKLESSRIKDILDRSFAYPKDIYIYIYIYTRSQLPSYNRVSRK